VAGVLLQLVIGGSALAQEKAPPQGSRIAFQHDGRGVIGFVLYAKPENGPELRIDLGHLVPDATGSVTVPMPALPPGRYVIEVAAYNDAGESPRVSASPSRLTVTAGAPGSSPAEAAPPAATAPASAPQPVERAPSPSAPQATTPKSGFWSRFWRFLVGED
jgi:hypothetical protein